MSADFRVGSWLVQPSLNTISRNGMTARVEPKVMEVLVCLAGHAGKTVQKETLVQGVWPDTFVSDDALKHCISELRRVFEDDAREPRIIQTIPKRGYRLLAPVAPVNGTKDLSTLTAQGSVRSAPARIGARRVWTATLAVGVAASLMLVVAKVSHLGKRSTDTSDFPPIHSLAVLPLQNLSSDPAQEYFSDGMTDALITDLAQISSVKVISRTSSMQYKQTKKSLPEIAHDLKVDGIIEGTVQRSGDRVRITAQLIQGVSDKHLWANTYERDMHDVFALERDVTEDIARQVQERIRSPKVTPLVVPRHVDARALEAYFQGNYHLESFGKGGGDEEKKKAADYFQQAIDADPGFAPPYNGLARAHLGLLWPSNQDAEIATKSAERAEALDPNLSDTRKTLGDINLASWNWSAAEEEYRRAIANNPNNADAHDGLGELLLIVGKVDEGWSESQIAQALDPNWDHLSDALERRGQYDSAIDRQEMMLKRYPDNGYLHVALFWEYLSKRMYKKASFHLDQVAILFGFPQIAAEARRARRASGYRGAIRESLKGWEHLMSTHQAFLPVNIAELYTALGDKERAFYWLEQAYAHHDIGIASTDLGLERLNKEYLLDPLRSDQRFKDLLRRVGLPPEHAPS